jgi:hypothetical protein
MIEKAHQAWKNPAVTESLAARSREHPAAIQAAVAACRERLQNRQRALSPFPRVSVPTYFLLLLFHLYLLHVFSTLLGLYPHSQWRSLLSI